MYCLYTTQGSPGVEQCFSRTSECILNVPLNGKCFSVYSDFNMALGKGHVALLELLDLIAEFDTIDHDVLVKRLEVSFGLRGTPLKWMKSYVVGRTQTVIVNRSISSMVKLSCGIPQGSVLRPLLFVCKPKTSASSYGVMVCGSTAMPTIRRFISIASLKRWTHLLKNFRLVLMTCVDGCSPIDLNWMLTRPNASG